MTKPKAKPSRSKAKPKKRSPAAKAPRAKLRLDPVLVTQRQEEPQGYRQGPPMSTGVLLRELVAGDNTTQLRLRHADWLRRMATARRCTPGRILAELVAAAWAKDPTKGGKIALADDYHTGKASSIPRSRFNAD